MQYAKRYQHRNRFHGVSDFFMIRDWHEFRSSDKEFASIEISLSRVRSFAISAGLLRILSSSANVGSKAFPLSSFLLGQIINQRRATSESSQV
jgi:hypothetical protein